MKANVLTKLSSYPSKIWHAGCQLFQRAFNKIKLDLINQILNFGLGFIIFKDYKVLREIGFQWWYHLLLFFLVFLPKSCIVYDKLVTEIVFLKYMDFFSRRISTSKVTVLGYGLLTTDAETLIDALNTQNFSVVIVDESHYMKSRNATRSKVLLPIVQKAKRAILLTGTPALGRPEEVLKSLYLGLTNKQTN